MKSFKNWVQLKETNFSLASLSDFVSDPDWHTLYDKFVRYYNINPDDPSVEELGSYLYSSGMAAQEGDHSRETQILKPMKEKYIWAKKIQ